MRLFITIVLLAVFAVMMLGCDHSSYTYVTEEEVGTIHPPLHDCVRVDYHDSRGHYYFCKKPRKIK